jgi:hypothetical protein
LYDSSTGSKVTNSNTILNAAAKIKQGFLKEKGKDSFLKSDHPKREGKTHP